MVQNSSKSFFLIILIILPLTHTEGNIEFSRFELDSSPRDLIWCGNDNSIAIILTEKNSIYRSEDRGMNWKKLNDIFTNTGKEELEENENEIGKVSSIIQSPADKTLLIFLGTQGINWIGEECGLKIKALNHGRKINEFIFHPTERNWGLASAYTLCNDFVGEPCKIYQEVFYTKDLGVNWNQIGKYVVQFGWGLVEQSQITKGVPKERILMTYEPRGTGDQKNTGWNYKVDLIYSDDFFKTFKVLASKGNKFLVTNHYLFVATVVDQEAQEVQLLLGKSTHFDYDLQPIETNQKSFLEHSYTFLDSTFHRVFLHINHFGESSPYGHIYTSGPRGLKYSLSLKNNIRSDGNQCDFEKVNSVEGVYIANVISGKYMKLAAKEIQQVQQKKKESMTKDNKKNTGSHHISNLSYKDYIKTEITFNRGGDWQRLKAPERDSEGKKYNCGNYCYLNLFGISSDHPPFYSVDSAVGLIIGNGNVGHYLSKDVATFLSRDGGLTWFEIRKGSHIYEIGDGGGLILLADDEKPSNSILYTWDEGLSWEEKKISDEKFLIRNIIIEPTSQSHNFIIYGESMKGGVKKGISIGLNFGSVYDRCKYPEKAGSAESDYEIWSPSDGRAGVECLLGHKIQIVRRKRESKCVNTEKFERKITKLNCDCTELDYMCDMGYQRSEPGSPCTRIGDGKIDETVINKPPLDCKGTYKISKGYRRIPGDTCINGVKYDPIVLPCPYSGFFGNFGLYIFIALIIIFAIVIYYLMDKDVSCDFDFNGINELFSKIFSGEHKMYNPVNLDEEDNALFEDENKIMNPIGNKSSSEETKPINMS